jgi:hypothetical protein
MSKKLNTSIMIIQERERDRDGDSERPGIVKSLGSIAGQ